MLGHFIAAGEPEFLETMVSINFCTEMRWNSLAAVPKNAAHLTEIKWHYCGLIIYQVDFIHLSNRQNLYVG